MNVYDDFFRHISPEDWEFFAIDFLVSNGFLIINYPSRGSDGGSDGIVEYNNIKYIVSCKHYLNSGKSIGTDIEQSILDRTYQHGANGFIGFYSTLVSSSLQNRLNQLKDKINILIYDRNIISNYLPKISSSILQKYGLPNQFQYILNVAKKDYKPLNCLICSKDILQDENISFSMALITKNKNDEFEYLYGCKNCIRDIPDRGWCEINQVLHLEQLNGWLYYVDELVKNANVSNQFYKNKNDFESRLQQKLFPSNWGQWLPL
ncbi:restriction endonuclease [Sulfurospirillum halorespirans]|uniref:Uncharacterized protein n=1 Tax=Sulfurospirillum halorespirans DSM 13726 TaxID=1193502 RepID=A0A1D7TIF7_9BACT|nr:restriction endonuclease [Sulfurospirillum halorespirans]AOO64805.1 hypothetical protein SHALO_1025 [Sulfurospirillum halorespirans DSM 13726]